MPKILIADASYGLCEGIIKQLKPPYLAVCCQDGQKAIELIYEMDPDILVLDLALPNVDSIATIIKMLRSIGKNIPVLVLAAYLDDHIVSVLQDMRVFCVLWKPCDIDALVQCIYILLNRASISLWMPETEVDNILMMLGFRVELRCYENVRTAILLQFYGEADGMVKCLYPAVAKRNGGNAVQVEKSIRDAIRYAFQRGDRSRWALYFPFAGENQCPSNKAFIARIVYALQTLERLPNGKIR